MKVESKISTVDLPDIKEHLKIKIGVLGDSRNATIAAAHEFGTKNLPRRSILFLTLKKKKKEIVKIIKGILSNKINTKTAELMLEALVIETINKSGYGTWPKSKDKKNPDKKTLIDTGQLRRAMTAKVEKK